MNIQCNLSTGPYLTEHYLLRSPSTVGKRTPISKLALYTTRWIFTINNCFFFIIEILFESTRRPTENGERSFSEINEWFLFSLVTKFSRKDKKWVLIWKYSTFWGVRSKECSVELGPAILRSVGIEYYAKWHWFWQMCCNLIKMHFYRQGY